MTEWFYTKMGLKQGPVPEDELRTKIRRAEIGPSTLVWKEGMAEWLPLSRMPDLLPPEVSEGRGPVDAHVEELPQQAPPEAQVSAIPKPAPLGNIPLPQPPAYEGNYVAPKIPNYMWQSVLATVLGLFLCCLLGMPFGVVAIVYASKVEGLRVQGNYAAATATSNLAKGWMIASFVVSGLGLLGVIARLIQNA